MKPSQGRPILGRHISTLAGIMILAASPLAAAQDQVRDDDHDIIV